MRRDHIYINTRISINIKIDANVNINMEMSVLISQSKDIFRDFAILRIHIVYTLLQPVDWFGWKWKRWSRLGCCCYIYISCIIRCNVWLRCSLVLNRGSARGSGWGLRGRERGSEGGSGGHRDRFSFHIIYNCDLPIFPDLTFHLIQFNHK